MLQSKWDGQGQARLQGHREGAVGCLGEGSSLEGVTTAGGQRGWETEGHQKEREWGYRVCRALEATVRPLGFFLKLSWF